MKASTKAQSKRGMIAIDLDGTLLTTQRTIHPEVAPMLKQLRQRGVLTIISTGRSLFSACKVVPSDLPVDYISFSNGAGIARWPSQEIVLAQSLESSHIQNVLEYLERNRFDFMLHETIPNNHRFVYRVFGDQMLEDFARRVALYRDHASAWTPKSYLERATQFLVVESEGVAQFQLLSRTFSQLSVIRTTSPLDERSCWAEILPAKASKSQAAAWLAQEHGVPQDATAAVGNDYNDICLLDWATHGFVVANTPKPLQKEHRVVASHNDGGCLQAIQEFAALL